jgi:hypothetical protein
MLFSFKNKLSVKRKYGIHKAATLENIFLVLFVFLSQQDLRV